MTIKLLAITPQPSQRTFHPGLAAIETTIQSTRAPQVTDATFDP